MGSTFYHIRKTEKYNTLNHRKTGSYKYRDNGTFSNNNTSIYKIGCNINFQLQHFTKTNRMFNADTVVVSNGLNTQDRPKVIQDR